MGLYPSLLYQSVSYQTGFNQSGFYQTGLNHFKLYHIRSMFDCFLSHYALHHHFIALHHSNQIYLII